MTDRTCPETQLLLEYVAGLGSPELRRELAAHVDGCARCRQIVSAADENLTRPRSDNNHTRLERIQVSGCHLGCDVAGADSSVSSTPEDATGEELDSRFDVGLLDPPRAPGVLGHLGKYDVLDVLGYGGMGVVLRAQDPHLLRPVAIKVMSRELASSPTARRRFIREARAAAAVNHPNVVTIHAVEEHNGVPYLVMELISGESLRDRLRHPPRLSMTDVLSISFQIASGLAAAHAHGVIHRDIKPGNVMLEDELHRVKITDFGLARVALDNVDLTSDQIGIGTPAYMSPEQVKGEEVDPRSDLFALGCVMYAMLRGHSPFHGRNTIEIARNVAEQPPDPPTADSDVPTFLSEMIDRLLEKSPDKRFQSAGEVAEILRQHLAVLNQTPTDKLGLVPIKAPPPLPAPAPRRRIGLLAAASLLFVVLGIAGLAAWQYLRSRLPKLPPLSDTAAGARPRPPPVPLAQLRPVVTVAKLGKADFTSINEALRHVAPGGKVIILDDAEYVERVLLDDPAHCAGITLAAPRGATLRAPDHAPVIRIAGVSKVRLEGFKAVASQDRIGIQIDGPSPGVHLENIVIERTPEASPEGSNGALVLRSAVGRADQPIVVHRVSIRSTNVGLVIADYRNTGVPSQHILVEECQVHGLSRDTSTLFALVRATRDVVIRRNVFALGMTGVGIETEEGRFSDRCELALNTFHDVKNWITCKAPIDGPMSVRFHHNLIIDSDGVSSWVRSAALRSNSQIVFADNYLFNPNGNKFVSFEPLATTIEIPFLSLNRAHPDYLKPDFPRWRQSGSLPHSIPGRYAEEAPPN